MLWLTLKQLKSSNPQTRIGCIEKLAEEADESVIGPLLGMLSDSVPAVRLAAIKVLGKHRDERINESLIACLQDSESAVRELAAHTLKRLGETRAIPALVTLLNDGSEAARWHAASALEALGWNPKDDQQRALRAVAMGKYDQALIYGSTAIDPLVTVLKQGVYYKKMEAVEALSRIGDARVVKPLVATLGDADSNVRAAVVHALSKIGDSRAVEALVVALKDADSKVRTAAVEALGRFGDAHAIDPLVRLLSDSNWDVRAAVVEALGRFKERRVAEALLPVLKDNDPDIRRLAAAALGKMGDPMAIEGLVLTLKDEQEPVRQAAEASLMKIDRNWESSESARRAIPALQDALKSHEYWVRTCAASVLKRIVGEEQAATVDDNTVIADRATYLKQEGAVVLIQALRDEDRDVRQAAAEALGRLGHKPAIEALALVLQDEDEWVRHAAANALEGLNWQPADEVLRARHAVVLQRWDAAVVLGGAAMGPLLQASVSGDGITRYRAAMCLGQLGDARAVPALASLLSDTYQPVRQAAAQALVAVGLCHATPKQQAAAAVELREWDKAINLGADAVEAMADAVRKRNEDPEWSAAAAVSLAQVTDPAAFTPLLALLGDPEVAAESLQSLETLLQLSAEGIETAHLERAIDLGSVFYDRYELEEITKMALKVGTEELDTTRLKVLARMELDRRGVGASTHSTTT